MQAERDALVKVAFPRLRALCDERGVIWGEVDLRWGITEEERLDGRVLPICFDQIDACRPYFIGVLGSRYGSRAEIPEALVERHSWLERYRDCSVTDLEVRYGALHAGGGSGCTFFYLREDAARTPSTETAEPDDPVVEERLVRLRADIHQSGHPVAAFGAPAQLSDLVYQHLSAAIDRDFPEVGRVGTIEDEVAFQFSHSETRARLFSGRSRYLDALDTHVESDGPPLALTGPSGIGKSTLIAAWLDQRAASWRARHPTCRLARYFVGASSDGSGWRRLAEAVLAQLGTAPPRGSTGDSLRRELQISFDRVGAEGGAIILLDAVNQLDPYEGALELSWLPPKVHPGIRLVVSTTEGASADECRRRGWSELPVGELDPAESLGLASDFLSQRYGKELSKQEIELLLANPMSKMPLWLTAVLEELRLFGDYASLGRYLELYTSTSSVEELFGRILERWERDYGGSHTNMVRDALTSLWGSRRGLSEVELRERLAATGPFVPLDWTVFAAAAGAFLADRGGLIGLYHNQLRYAIERRYVADEYAKRAVHHELAADSARWPDGVRRRSELPWQLQQAREFSNLRALLCERDFIVAAWEEAPNDVGTYWTSVEHAGLESRAEAYTPLLNEPERELTLVGVVADVLSSAGFNRESLKVYERALARIDAEQLPLQAAQATLGAARLNGVLGSPDKALAGFSQAESTFRKLSKKSELLVCLGEHANALIGRGDLEHALVEFDSAAMLAQELEDLASLQSIHIGRAEILRLKGSISRAAEELSEAERLAKILGDRTALERAYGSWASFYDTTRDYEKMLEYAERKIAICEGLGDRAALASGLVLKALAIARSRRLDEAQELYERAATLFDAVGDISRAADVRVNLAVLLARRFERGDLDRQAMTTRATSMLEEQLRVYESIDERASLGTCLSTLGVMAFENGDSERGLDLLRKAIETEVSAGRLFTAADMRVDTADSLLDVGQSEEAFSLLKLALQYHLTHDKVAWAVSRNLRVISRAYALTQQPEAAAQQARLAEEWAIQSGLPEFVAAAIGQRAQLYEEAEDFGNAILERLREVEERAKHSNPRTLANSYRALHRAAARAACWDVAIEALAEQWRLVTESGGMRGDLEQELQAAVEALSDAEPGGAAFLYREALQRIMNGTYTDEWLEAVSDEFGVPADLKRG